MGIDAIAAVSAAAMTAPATAGSAPAGRTDFATLLGDGLAQVDEKLKVADQGLRALAAGQVQSPHEVMISMEEARMSLILMVEMRNRVVEAYQELVRMQL
ncbi:MAG: flagellar hook-basal body complex protein FliE [Rhizobium sp.]|nr:flagellar hook-basal body complex protein FliE [Rhizobium sp.]